MATICNYPEHTSDDFQLRSKLFVSDLLSAKNNEILLERLLATCDENYLSSYYFSDAEKEEILAMMVGGKSVREKLRELLSKKMHVCTAHHLAPLFSSAFNLQRAFQKQSPVAKFRKSYKGMM